MLRDLRTPPPRSENLQPAPLSGKVLRTETKRATDRRTTLPPSLLSFRSSSLPQASG